MVRIYDLSRGKKKLFVKYRYKRDLITKKSEAQHDHKMNTTGILDVILNFIVRKLRQ